MVDGCIGLNEYTLLAGFRGHLSVQCGDYAVSYGLAIAKRVTDGYTFLSNHQIGRSADGCELDASLGGFAEGVHFNGNYRKVVGNLLTLNFRIGRGGIAELDADFLGILYYVIIGCNK